MKSASNILIGLFLALMTPWVCDAQCRSDGNGCMQGVPHFIKLNGQIKNTIAGSRSAVVAVRFVIYDAATNGTALWQEVQNVAIDGQGHYELMLGVTAHDGVPTELFTSGEARWLGVQLLSPGVEEEPRVLIVSVPYALEAGDAQTLGGLPASAYSKASPAVGAASESSAPAPSAVSTLITTNNPTSAGSASSTSATPSANAVSRTVGTLPKFAANGTLEDSQVIEANGGIAVRNLDNILFADHFPGGVPDAIAACPANGCIIYAVSPNVNLNLGTIDPGTKAITVYLGPFHFNVTQIILRKALKIIGMGAAGGVTGSPTCSSALPCNGTTLQSLNGNNPVFVIPQTNNTPATNVLLSGFRVSGAAGNKNQDGFFLDTSSTTNSGLWFSTIDDVFLDGFSGIPIHIRGRSNDFSAATEWTLFNNVIAFRTPGGGNALRLEGSVFELRFRNCEFDGQAIGDGTNIYIGGSRGAISGYPISIAFEGLVSQAAATAVQLDGAFNIVFNASHHEKLWGAYSVTNDTGIGTHGLTISDSYFAGDVGVNGGAGYELKIGTSLAYGVFFAHNQMYGNPDAVIAGTNLASVAYQDNLYTGDLPSPPTAGLTTQMNPGTIINIGGVHSVGLNTSATPITTIRGSLGPGEMVTFFTLGGSVRFSAGGNIDLMGSNTLMLTGSITFVRVDLGGLLWKPVAQWNAPLPPPRRPPLSHR